MHLGKMWMPLGYQTQPHGGFDSICISISGMVSTALVVIMIIVCVLAIALGIYYKIRLNQAAVALSPLTSEQSTLQNSPVKNSQQPAPRTSSIPAPGVANAQQSPSIQQSVDKPKSLVDRLKAKMGNWQVPYSEIKFGRLLGKGSQGEVYLAEWRGSMIAVKKIDVRNVEEQILEEFCSEAEIMHRLRHPSLSMFMGVCLEPPYLCILTELVPRGSLFDMLQDECIPISWNLILRMAIDCAEGMNYLHNYKPSPVLHRDLKSLNLLVDENWRIKIIDFGMTRFQELNANMTQCGSPLWMAPEMIKNEPYDEHVDVYSYGIVLWELYTRRVPYVGMEVDPNQLVSRVVYENMRPPIPKHCPLPFAKLMQDCWAPKIKDRPSFAEILVRLREIKAAGLVPGQPNKTANPSALQHLQPKPSADLIAKQKAEAMAKAEADAAKAAAEEEEKIRGAQEQGASAAFPGASGPSRSSIMAAMEAWRIESRELVFGPTTELGLTDDYSDGKWRGKAVCVRRWPIHAGDGPQQYLGHDAKLKIPKSAAQVFERFASVRHPNVQLFMGMCVNKMSGDAGLVFEEVTRGTLAHVLEQAEQPFDWDTKIQMVQDVVLGLTFLHGVKPAPVHLAHLSSNSVIVDGSNRLKLAEIFTADLTAAMGAPFHQAAVTLQAPELELNGYGAASSASDVFHFGTLCWEIFSEQTISEGLSAATRGNQSKSSKGRVLPSLDFVPSDLRDLIESCWNEDAAQRPPLSQVLARIEQLKQNGPTKLVLSVQNGARKYIKRKLTLAFRSTDPVSIAKKWGKSQGKDGCWVVVAEEDDVYCVDDEVFKSTYVPSNKVPNMYRKMGFILAKQMNSAFAIKTLAGTVELGSVGDFLAQNDQGEVWPIATDTFNQLYEEAR